MVGLPSLTKIVLGFKLLLAFLLRLVRLPRPAPMPLPLHTIIGLAPWLPAVNMASRVRRRRGKFRCVHRVPKAHTYVCAITAYLAKLSGIVEPCSTVLHDDVRNSSPTRSTTMILPPPCARPRFRLTRPRSPAVHRPSCAGDSPKKLREK